MSLDVLIGQRKQTHKSFVFYELQFKILILWILELFFFFFHFTGDPLVK